MNRARAAVAALCLLLAVAFAGCAHRSGHQVPYTQTYNLRVDNLSSSNDITVLVDDGVIGHVSAFQSGYFFIHSGLRKVELRADADTSAPPVVGYFDFPGGGALVQVAYDD